MKALRQKVITAYKNLIRCWSVEKKSKETVEEKNIGIQISRNSFVIHNPKRRLASLENCSTNAHRHNKS